MDLDNKTLQSKSKGAVAVNSQESKSDKSSQSHFEDNRSEAVHQRKLQSFAENSSNNQNSIQLQTASGVVSQEIAPQKENKTGLPDDLKDGVEDLSGYSMDDVKVHHNSDKPNELNAHAYAQGTDIHLASGQEKHLPHEAWHVVQQKQGRVKPTTQLKGKVPINDDAGLEKEADLMGAKAASQTVQTKVNLKTGSDTNSKIAQREEKPTKGLEKDFQISLEKDMLILRGNTSWWGSIGEKSRFSKLAEAIDVYYTLDDSKKKDQIGRIFSLANNYEDNHKHGSDENETLRRKSVKQIIARIDAYLKNKQEGPIEIARTDDKLGVGADIINNTDKEEDKTPYMQVINSFSDYQNTLNELIKPDLSIFEVIKIINRITEKAPAVLAKINNWREKHKDDWIETDRKKEKREVISRIEKKLSVIRFNLKLKYADLFRMDGVDIDFDPLKKKDLKISSVGITLLNDLPESLKNFKAEANNVTITEKEIDFEEIIISKPPTEFNPFEGFSFKNPKKVTLSKKGAQYTLFIDNTNINIKKEGLFEIDTTISGTFNYNSGEGNKPKLIDSLNIPEVKIKLLDDVPEFIKGVEATGKGISITSEGGSYSIDYREVELSKISKDFNPFDGVKISTPDSLRLLKNKDNYTLKVGESSIKAVAGNFFKASATGKADLKYSTGSPEKLNILDSITLNEVAITMLEGVPSPLKNLTATGEGVEIKEDGNSYNVDYKMLSLTALPEKFSPIEGFSITTPQQIELIKKTNTEYFVNVSEASFNISAGGWVDANGKATAKFAYKISEEIGNLDSEILFSEASAKLGDAAPELLHGIEGSASNLKISSGYNKNELPKGGGVDWDKITLSISTSEFKPFNGPVTFTPPNKAEVLGSKDNYETTFKGGAASAKIGKKEGDAAGLEGSGKADFFIDKKGNKGLKNAHLEIDAESPMIPGESQFWPVNITLPISLPPTPVEAYFTLSVNGGIQGGIKGGFDYENSTEEIKFNIKGGVKGNLKLSIELGAGVGSQYLIYLGLFVKALSKLTAEGTGTAAGKLSKKDSDYKLDEASLNYKIGADVVANVSLGAKAKALFFYEKTLYEVNSSDWEIGHTEKEGTYNLSSAEDKGTGGTGLLSNSENGIPKKLNILTEKYKIGSFELKEVTKSINEVITALKDGQRNKEEDEKLRQKMKSLQIAFGALHEKTIKIKPELTAFFRREKTKDISEALQLLGEIKDGDFQNFEAVIDKSEAKAFKKLPQDEEDGFTTVEEAANSLDHDGEDSTIDISTKITRQLYKIVELLMKYES